MLPAVHEAPGPDFLHDLDSYGSYYSQESISRSHMFPIDTLGNITFLGLDIDRDVGGPHMEEVGGKRNLEFTTV